MVKPPSIPGRSPGLYFLLLILRIGGLFLLFLKTEASRHNGDNKLMPNASETPWVTLEVNDVLLSLCNDLGRPNLRMISWSTYFYHLLSLLSLGGKAFNPSCECIYHD